MEYVLSLFCLLVSSFSPLQRDHTELLHQIQGIRIVPVFRNLPISNAVPVHTCHRHLIATGKKGAMGS